MPRRRGSAVQGGHQQNSTGRRALAEDGRWNGNNKKGIPIPPPTKSSLKVAEESPPGTSTGPEESMARAALEETASATMSAQGGDLGYMHKKFKKVAPTFLVQPSDSPPAQALAPTTAPAEEQSPKSKEEDGKSGAAKGGRYVCPYCQHACAKPSVLEKHIRAHTNERPYPCIPCGFAFKTKSNLYKHCKSRTHVLKLEETGAGASAVDPPEAGSDDTSDDNVNEQALTEDSDEGEQVTPPSAPAPLPTTPAPDGLPSSSPEKFKTPYKPKFHNFKPTDETQVEPTTDVPQPPPMAPPTSVDGIAGPLGSRPSPGFLQERISQIISKNQAIVETKDPIWSRRYVRQSSRDREATTPKVGSGPRMDVLSPSAKKNLSRERSSSLNDPSSGGEIQLPVPSPSVHSALRVLQEADESQRKRCHSEGPVDNLLRHSVRNLLHQPAPPKLQRTEAVPAISSQNTEGSIIKDILLMSRGLLPADSTGKDAADPPKMSSSFSVRALLNSSSSSRPKPAESTKSGTAESTGGDNDSDDRPFKKIKMSPDSSAFLRPSEGEPPRSSALSSAIVFGSREDAQQRNHVRASLPPFGGEVEVHDGHQRTVMRIDSGFGGDSSGSSHRLNGLIQNDVPAIVTSSVVVTKSSLSFGGGLVHVQLHEPHVSVFPVKRQLASGSGGLLSDHSSTIPTDSISKGVVSIPRPASPPPTLSGLPYIPGMPGPYSSGGWVPTCNTYTYSMSSSCTTTTTSSKTSSFSPIPLITVHPPAGMEEEGRTEPQLGEDGRHSSAGASTSSGKFLRPSSLSLQPGTFSVKKANMAGVDPSSGLPNMLCVSGPGGTLISPETPRPRKLIRQLYLNGHAYTYLGLKCSTRVYFCCLSRAQPMYVLQQCHPKLSMYSQWKTRAPPSELEASSPVQTMMLYDSRQRPCTFTAAQSSESTRMILTHSSYWTNRDRPATAHLKLEVVDEPPAAPPLTTESQENAKEVPTQMEVAGNPQPAQPPSTTAAGGGAQPKRVRIFAGGYKSTEEYTYVRGRGRGRYVCEECGIRCKKPSMLKKHIRTHTDLRPYTCRQCNFSFKTKGNLTKHMKSKAHHKKCTELGIVPVPTSVDDANIDEDSLARQETLKKMKLAGGGSGNEGDSDLDDEDEDDEEDDEDEEAEGDEEEDEMEEDPHPTVTAGETPATAPAPIRLPTSGQFEDASEERIPVRGEREQEVARSLLDLGVMAPAGSKPTTYPYAGHFHPVDAVQLPVTPEVPHFPGPSVEQPLKKEEHQPPSTASPASPSPSERKMQQPMDLSTLRSTPHSTAGLVASAYSQKVATEAALHGKSSPSPAESEGGAQPAGSGMLQAYLTEKALKDGLMKRHHVKLPIPSTSVGESKGSILMVLPSANQQAERETQPSSSQAHLPPRNPGEFPPKVRPEFVAPLSSTSSLAVSASSSASAQAAYRLTDDGKTACSICNKVFTKPSQLRLHINIHYFERPFRCDACAVSFRTKGHLQKHKRSVTHFNKVNMNLTFGTPSTENPRPFKCSDCMIAFRIHGHLAKHLRSKMHIMKLECLGKLPFGTYAEMERSGVNLNEIDTTDCHNSLESLQSLAHRLYKQDPSKIQQWQQEAQASESSLRERTISCSSEDFSDMADEGDDLDEDGDARSEDSDGVPDAVHDVGHQQERLSESSDQRAETLSVAAVTRTEDAIPKDVPPREAPTTPPPPAVEPKRSASVVQPAMFCSACGESCSSMESFQVHVMEKHRPSLPPASSPARQPETFSPPPLPAESPSKMELPESDRAVNLALEARRSSPLPTSTSQWSRNPDVQYSQPSAFYHPATVPSVSSLSTGAGPVQQLSAMWPPRPPTFGDYIGLNPLAGLPTHWHQDPAAMAWIASHHMMLPLTLPGQAHPHNYPMPPGHAVHGGLSNGTLQPRLYSPTNSTNIPPAVSEDPIFPCDICGKTFTAKEPLRQHMLLHAQPRPFVCEFCDAGFTTQKHLESHLVLHRPRTS